MEEIEEEYSYNNVYVVEDVPDEYSCSGTGPGGTSDSNSDNEGTGYPHENEQVRI